MSPQKGSHFDFNAIDGAIESVCVQHEEDYLIAMAYIAECLTFKRGIDLECFNVERERDKIVDLLLSLLNIS